MPEIQLRVARAKLVVTSALPDYWHFKSFVANMESVRLTSGSKRMH
jgi:hypothetical protein